MRSGGGGFEPDVLLGDPGVEVLLVVVVGVASWLPVGALVNCESVISRP